MILFSRFSAILCTLMLAFASLGLNHDEKLLTIAFQDVAAEEKTSQFSEKKLYDVYGLHQSGEQLVSSVNSLPAPNSKLQSAGFLSGSFSIELRIQNIAADYLSQLRKADPGLSIRVLIFPFHYFW